MAHQNFGNSGVVVDALADPRRGTSVEQRIQARIDLLKVWFSDGIPAGLRQSLPNSLTQLRAWKLEEHGIEPIGSPNDFTKTHPRYGTLVSEAQEALTRLLKKYPASGTALRRRAKAKPNVDTRPDYEKLVSNYHMERDQRLAAEKRAMMADLRTRQAEEELAALRRKIAEDVSAGKFRAVQ